MMGINLGKLRQQQPQPTFEELCRATEERSRLMSLHSADQADIHPAHPDSTHSHMQRLADSLNIDLWRHFSAQRRPIQVDPSKGRVFHPFETGKLSLIGVVELGDEDITSGIYQGIITARYVKSSLPNTQALSPEDIINPHSSEIYNPGLSMPIRQENLALDGIFHIVSRIGSPHGTGESQHVVIPIADSNCLTFTDPDIQ